MSKKGRERHRMSILLKTGGNDFSFVGPIMMIDKECAYYKCHTDLQDCTFCYCPVYPCKIKALGKYIIHNNKRVWSCAGCSLPHNKKIVKEIKAEILKIMHFYSK